MGISYLLLTIAAETRNLFKFFSNDVGLLAAQYADGLRVSILSGKVDVNYGVFMKLISINDLKDSPYCRIANVLPVWRAPVSNSAPL